MVHFNRLFWTATAITLLLLCGAPAVADILVYQQPPTLNGVFYASQNDTNGFGNFATVYDNFQIYSHTSAYYLTDVFWYGGYFNPPVQGNITGWTISLYSNPLGPIGTLPIWTQHFGVPNAGYLENCGLPSGTCAYHQDDIMGGYKLMPNTTYWLALVPDLGFPPQWGWGTGLLGDGVSYQDFFGTRTQLGVDFAFSISAVPTPEPGSLILLGAGILGLAGTLRRRLF